jgi:hypothetical protein
MIGGGLILISSAFLAAYTDQLSKNIQQSHQDLLYKIENIKNKYKTNQN